MTRYPPPAWNETTRAFSRDATIPDLTRAAARAHPDRPALVDGAGTVVTHAELDARSDRLAELLRRLGVGRGRFVALYSGRTPAAVTAVLAVLKAGAAYVPIDPAWPVTRAVRLLTDLDVGCLLAGADQLRAAQELRWSVPALRHVVCPDAELPATADPAATAELFDYLVSDDDPLTAAGFRSPSGSDTGYDRDDLRAYQEHVAQLAAGAAGPHADVLEVGCGSGLVVDALGPGVRRYVATDPAPAAVARVLDAARGRWSHVEGVVCFAHDVERLVTGRFDLVVVASAAQFFPDLEYFLDALASLTRVLRPGGTLLLADLVDPAAERHSGLRLSPALFRRLPEILPAVTSVVVRSRAGTGLRHELASRFDVLVRVDPDRVPESVPPRTRTLWTGADLAALPAGPPPVPVRAEDIAYAIFTSGSTGVPKAVVVAHRSVVNLIEWVNRCHGVRHTDRLLFVTSFCFDLSVYDMFGVLAAGATIRVADEGECREPETLIDILYEEDITVWDSAPAAADVLVPFLGLRPRPPVGGLRLVLLSGDWIPLTLPDALRASFPRATVAALGGATECTVWSNQHIVSTVDPSWASIPYGRPMDNAQYHVLDDQLRPCPLDVEGDLFIAGECVAVGYARAPSVTATRFLPNPWATRPGTRMYWTGDRARWRTEGVIEFLGRTDDQVKIRGFRVELGEVRAAVAQCPGVRSAAVVAVAGPVGTGLAVFYVPADGGADEEAVRRFLRDTLPEYMVPADVLAVDALPVSDTGKVDRAALRSRLRHATGVRR